VERNFARQRRSVWLVPENLGEWGYWAASLADAHVPTRKKPTWNNAPELLGRPKRTLGLIEGPVIPVLSLSREIRRNICILVGPSGNCRDAWQLSTTFFGTGPSSFLSRLEENSTERRRRWTERTLTGFVATGVKQQRGTGLAAGRWSVGVA
jgi:hypothetical protein